MHSGRTLLTRKDFETNTLREKSASLYSRKRRIRSLFFKVEMLGLTFEDMVLIPVGR